jgi:hypothetical protein
VHVGRRSEQSRRQVQLRRPPQPRGGWLHKHTCHAENRLVEVIPAEDDPNNLTADDKKLVFTYDYLNRRVRKVVYAWDPNEGESGDWSATAELDLRFICHERLLLLELDGLDSNAKVRKHVWGPGTDAAACCVVSRRAVRIGLVPPAAHRPSCGAPPR